MRAPSVVLASVVLAACSGDTKSTDAKDVSAQSPQSAQDPESAQAPEKVSLCDAAEVDALTGFLNGADARARRDLVTRSLADACALPPLVTDYIAARGSGATDNAPPHPATPALEQAARSVCPGAAVIMKQAEAVSGQERSGLIFDRCNFSRFDLLGRTAFVEQTSGSLVPFYAYEWMTGEGVAPDQAKAVAQALLLADRHDWNHKGLTLPTADYAVGPVPEGVEVRVTKTAIEVAGETVVELTGKSEAGSHVEPLRLAFNGIVDKQPAPKDGVRRVVVAADKGVDPATIVTLVHTATVAKFAEVALLTEEAPMVFGAVVVRGDAYRGAAGPSVFVVIDDKGFEVRELGGRSAKPQRIAAPDPAKQWDYDALSKHAAAFKARNSGAEGVTVAVSEGVPYEVLLHSIVALRGANCDVDGTCVLPKVRLGTVASAADAGRLVASAGLLGALSAESGTFLASPYGGAFAVGSDDEDVWGGLTGSEVGEAYGVGGLGLVGTGRGGGGTGEGKIGLGSTGLIGSGGGGGTGSGYGRGSGAGFGGRGKRVPRVRQAKATVKGPLDKDIIRRIVRAHINEVRYCYTQGLAKDDALEGRVQIDFEIGGTGKVTSAAVGKTTVSDTAVGKCMAKAVKRWKFPKPVDGATVSVSYPFNLSPG